MEKITGEEMIALLNIEDIRVQRIIIAMLDLMKKYKRLADSGDCGDWSVEEEEEYINCVEALKLYRDE